MNKKVFITKSFKETQKIGKGFVAGFNLCQGVTLPKKSACVIALYGDLGSGKTTFVQGLAKGLGIKRRIISPTFVIIRSYNLKTQNSNLKTTTQNSKLFYHIDLYRIKSDKDIRGLGLQEIMSDPQNIVAIEWAQNMGDFLPKLRIDIRFFYESNKRRIEIYPIDS